MPVAGTESFVNGGYNKITRKKERESQGKMGGGRLKIRVKSKGLQLLAIMKYLTILLCSLIGRTAGSRPFGCCQILSNPSFATENWHYF
jgi:hypothetical protein